ncbi:MAG: Leucyl/phenylalanyl-tRNA--protein transferase [Desulfovibrio sp.]
MPVFLRPDRNVFPPLSAASEEGLLAIGGSLSRERLLSAYARGIFPWYDKSTPILWWAPPERCMVRPSEIHIPRSLRRVIRSGRFTVTFDTAFSAVIRACARSPRPDQDGTWIVPEMVAAYCDLHEAGYAHSVEAWQDGELAGGLYGVSLGRAFFGESMFFKVPDASKVCFVWLAKALALWNFTLIDCQQVTDNLLRFGAYAVSREIFTGRLVEALLTETVPGKWRVPPDFSPL